MVLTIISLILPIFLSKGVTDSILDSRFSALLCGGWAVEQRRCADPKPSTSVFRAGESSLMEAIYYLLLLHERSSTVSPSVSRICVCVSASEPQLRPRLVLFCCLLKNLFSICLTRKYHAPSVTVLVLLSLPPSTHFPCTPAVTKISFALAPSASSVLALSINSSWFTIDLNYPSVRPQNNVLAVANIIPANDNITVTVPPVHAMIHYILTFVNITNIQRLRYQLIHRCRAQLRLCVCDRYGGEWNRDRRGRECDSTGASGNRMGASSGAAYPIVNARATLRARHQVRRSVLFELRRYSSTTLRPLAPQHHPTRPFALTSFARAALPSCRLIKVNIFMVR
ncbi:hypothetical protein B0H11DRAFT_2246299 [Mycena galericulata]|nr:hypothetical protein B0H11DRAFT_2246299 [Mycena galericulata]